MRFLQPNPTHSSSCRHMGLRSMFQKLCFRNCDTRVRVSVSCLCSSYRPLAPASHRYETMVPSRFLLPIPRAMCSPQALAESGHVIGRRRGGNNNHLAGSGVRSFRCSILVGSRIIGSPSTQDCRIGFAIDHMSRWPPWHDECSPRYQSSGSCGREPDESGCEFARELLQTQMFVQVFAQILWAPSSAKCHRGNRNPMNRDDPPTSLVHR